MSKARVRHAPCSLPGCASGRGRQGRLCHSWGMRAESSCVANPGRPGGEFASSSTVAVRELDLRATHNSAQRRGLHQCVPAGARKRRERRRASWLLREAWRQRLRGRRSQSLRWIRARVRWKGDCSWDNARRLAERAPPLPLSLNSTARTGRGQTAAGAQRLAMGTTQSRQRKQGVVPGAGEARSAGAVPTVRSVAGEQSGPRKPPPRCDPGRPPWRRGCLVAPRDCGACQPVPRRARSRRTSSPELAPAGWLGPALRLKAGRAPAPPAPRPTPRAHPRGRGQAPAQGVPRRRGRRGRGPRRVRAPRLRRPGTRALRARRLGATAPS